MSHSEQISAPDGTTPKTTVAAKEPGMAIDPKTALDRTTASQLLADSVFALIRYDYAFKQSTRFWHANEYTLKRWKLTAEAAGRWNQHFVPKLSIGALRTNASAQQNLPRTFTAIMDTTTEEITSFAQFFSELWLENLIARFARALRGQSASPKAIENDQSDVASISLAEWRVGCFEWARAEAQRAYNELLESERLAAKQREITRLAAIELEAEREKQRDIARLAAIELAAEQEKLAVIAREAQRQARAKAELEAEITRQQDAERENARKKLAAEAQAAELVRQAQLAALRMEYQKSLAKDYIATARSESYSNEDCSLSLENRHQAEEEFVKGWLENPSNIVIKFQPSKEQLQAISRIEPRLLVRARAGSGKTSTIVARVVFLIRHCRVAPKTILLFAFNKAAAEKIERDLVFALNLKELAAAEALNLLPVVQTFDAFAQAVSGSRPLEATEQRSLFQRAIELTLEENPEQVKSAMLQFFRAEWDRAELGILPGRDAVLGARRGEGALITLGGEQVKSRGEHRIANWLFEHNVPYKYERPVKQKGIFWAPDFTVLPDDPHPIFVEYLGLMGDAAYDEKTAYKKSKIAEISGETRPTVIWLAPESTTRQGEAPMPFIEHLTTNLALRKVTPQKLTDDEIWEKIKMSAISEFRKIVIAVVGRAKQARWSAEKLAREGQGSDVPLLLEICAEFMSSVDMLNTTGRYSYAEICWQAVDVMKDPSSRLRDLRNQNEKWRQIDLSAFNELIVDEFQDFSMRYNEIVSGVLKMAAHARLFVVGDDWQAINRYAGSDATYITGWADSEVVLSENNRSLPQIVNLGNSLMPHRGPLARTKPAQETATLLRMKLEELRPSELERNAVRDFTDLRPDVVAAISRLAIPHLREKKHVAVLARAQHQLDLSKGSVQRKNPLEKLLRDLAGPASGHVDVSTVHNYKGQEADVVILLADNFPLLHPHRVIYEVFGDTEAAIKEDERRLLYVGITRAKQALYFLTGIKERSDGLEKSLTLKPGSWTDFPAVGTHIESSDKRMITLQGWATSSFKEHLKVSGFKYSGPPLRRWERMLLARESTEGAIETILAAPWFPASPLEDELTIQVLDSGNTVLAEKTFQSRASAHSADHISKSSADDLPF
jgi:DNA helicase-4